MVTQKNQLRRNAAGWRQSMERYEQSDVTLKGASKNRRLMPGIPRGGGLWRQRWRQEASREGFTASSPRGYPASAGGLGF